MASGLNLWIFVASSAMVLAILSYAGAERDCGMVLAIHDMRESALMLGRSLNI